MLIKSLLTYDSLLHKDHLIGKKVLSLLSINKSTPVLLGKELLRISDYP